MDSPESMDSPVKRVEKTILSVTIHAHKVKPQIVLTICSMKQKKQPKIYFYEHKQVSREKCYILFLCIYTCIYYNI